MFRKTFILSYLNDERTPTVKRVFCVAIGVMMEFPDDTASVFAPLPKDPLDQLAERLRREVCFGRDCAEPDCTVPDMTVWLAAAFQECHG